MARMRKTRHHWCRLFTSRNAFWASIPDDESNLLPLSEEATSIALTRNAISALYTQDKSKEELFQPIIQVHQVDASLFGYSYANGTDNTHYIRVLFRNYSSSIKNGHVLKIKQHELRCFVDGGSGFNPCWRS